MATSHGANGEEAPTGCRPASRPTRDAIEAKLDTDLANVFPDDNGQAAAETPPPLPAESWSSAPTRQAVSSEDYNLEAFVAEREDARRPPLRPARPRRRRPDGAARSASPSSTRSTRPAISAPISPAIAERLGAGLAARRARCSRLVQSFEPTGVGARDLAECLAIQLRERDRFDPAMAALIANLELVARRDMAGLMRLCGVDAEDLAEMLAELRDAQPQARQRLSAARWSSR